MASPSPRAHLIRLGVLLVGVISALLWIRAAMVPKTWNSEEAFREASLEELARQPSIHGGNQSCINCHQGGEDALETHEDAMDDLLGGAHKNLSCESCHGPLGHHVADGRKIADALVNYSRVACLGCHNNLVSLPAGFPKFILSDEELTPQREAELKEAAQEAGDENFYRHKKRIHDGMNCTECHVSFHDPEP